MSTESFGSPKEAQEQMLRNSNIFRDSHQSSFNFCQRHPNKKAKYYADNDKSKLFCSKCALSLALMGLRIEATQPQEEIHRKSRLTAFTTKLSQVITCCEQKANALVESQNAFKRLYLSQKEQCTALFDALIAKANQLKQQHLQKLSATYTKDVQEFQQQAQLLKSSDHQLRQYLTDIQNNMDNIIKRMEMKPFEEIMGRYERKMDEHDKIIEAMHFAQDAAERPSINREAVETQLVQMCERLLNQSVAQDEWDEVYQSTCSNSLHRSNTKASSKPSHSPMRLPPFPKYQTNHSRRDSGHNTPDVKNNQQPTTPTDELMLRDTNVKPKANESSPREKTPKYQSMQQPQTSLNSSQTKQPDKNVCGVWSQENLNKNRFLETYNSTSGLILQKKMHSNKRSLSRGHNNDITSNQQRSDCKKQFMLDANPPGESLKDRIFKELSGAQTTQNCESVYNQVLKINAKKQQRYIKEKENYLSTDWAAQTTSTLRKNTFLMKK